MSIAHGFSGAIANLRNQSAFTCASTRRGIGIIAGGMDVWQAFLHREANGATEQAKPDNRDPFKAHRAASARARSTVAMASICSAVPMVIRTPLERPGVENQRVM